jgi:hypothetical protein
MFNMLLSADNYFDQNDFALSKLQPRRYILLNPSTGVTWHQKINKDFIDFVQANPTYLQQFVLTNNTGRLTHSLMQLEKLILDEWKVVVKHLSLLIVHPDKMDYRVSLIDTVVDKVDLPYPSRKQFHVFFIKLHRRLTRSNKDATSHYSYGRGSWTVSASCTFKMPDPKCTLYVEGLKESGAQFSPAQVADREFKYGSGALKRAMVSCDYKTPPTRGIQSELYTHWKQIVHQKKSLIPKFLSEYTMLQEIQDECGNNPDSELWALRLFWEDVFTSRCSKTVEPCGTCRECNIRCAQAIVVVFAAQGVADENILPHLGGMFRLPRYRNFGCKEWSMVSTDELAELLTPCSCHGLKGCYLHDWFVYVSSNGPPLSVEQCLCMYGMQKKSACLFLSAFMGSPVGVPVDRHLKVAFLNLGWVHPLCSDPTTMSNMIEIWLPMKETANLNNVVAGLRQLYQKTQHRQVLLDVVANCGRKHYSLLRRLTQDIKLPAIK